MTIEEIEALKKEDCPRFATFAKDKLPMPGKKKRLDDILEKEILITDFRLTKSKHNDGGQCLQLQFVCDGVVNIAFTGSVVLIDQIQHAKDQIPFRGTIVKVDRYYSFS